MEMLHEVSVLFSEMNTQQTMLVLCLLLVLLMLVALLLMHRRTKQAERSVRDSGNLAAVGYGGCQKPREQREDPA